MKKSTALLIGNCIIVVLCAFLIIMNINLQIQLDMIKEMLNSIEENNNTVKSELDGLAVDLNNINFNCICDRNGQVIAQIEPIEVEEVPQEEIEEFNINEPVLVTSDETASSGSDNSITVSSYSDLDDVHLIALCTIGEAEGESELGKRLVIDTILNRIDYPGYGSTASEVIWSPGQFSCMWNGRIDRCAITEEVCNLVREEMENRTNTEVLYFTAGGYGAYGTPLFQEGNHYFCGL